MNLEKKLPLPSSLSYSQKMSYIWLAIDSGISNRKLSPKAHGMAIADLKRGKALTEFKTDQIYSNIFNLQLLGMSPPSHVKSKKDSSTSKKPEKYLLKRIASLEDSVQKLETLLKKKF